MLFHMEHTGQEKWHWRWRIVGNYPTPYLAWREGVADCARVIFHPEVAGCEVEAQWRTAESGDWRQAALHECASGTALFRILARDGFSAPNGFRVVALVPGELIACYVFGPLALAPGRQATVTGTADGPFADNVLLAAGDFRSYGGQLEMDNLEPSVGSLVEPPNAIARLAAADGSASRRLFVKSNSMVQFAPPAEEYPKS